MNFKCNSNFPCSKSNSPMLSTMPFITISLPMQYSWPNDYLLKETLKIIEVYLLSATWQKINITKCFISWRIALLRWINTNMLLAVLKFPSLKKLRKLSWVLSLENKIRILMPFLMEALDSILWELSQRKVKDVGKQESIILRP